MSRYIIKTPAIVLNYTTHTPFHRDAITSDEYHQMKEETVDQIKEFTATLDRMNKGDVTLTSQFSQMRQSVRTAIASAFNASETMKMFGNQSVAELESQMVALNQALQLRRIDEAQHERERLALLAQLQQLGQCLSEADRRFFDTRHERLYERMEQIDDEAGPTPDVAEVRVADD